MNSQIIGVATNLSWAFLFEKVDHTPRHVIFTARFFIDFIKEKQVEFEEGPALDMRQLLSIPLLVVAIGFIIYGPSNYQRPSSSIK